MCVGMIHLVTWKGWCFSHLFKLSRQTFVCLYMWVYVNHIGQFRIWAHGIRKSWTNWKLDKYTSTFRGVTRYHFRGKSGKLEGTMTIPMMKHHPFLRWQLPISERGSWANIRRGQFVDLRVLQASRRLFCKRSEQKILVLQYNDEANCTRLNDPLSIPCTQSDWRGLQGSSIDSTEQYTRV